MFGIGVTVRLAEGITDESCLVVIRLANDVRPSEKQKYATKLMSP